MNKLTKEQRSIISNAREAITAINKRDARYKNFIIDNIYRSNIPVETKNKLIIDARSIKATTPSKYDFHDYSDATNATKRKIFIVDGPADKVKKAKLSAPRQCKVKVQSQGHDLGAGVVRSRGRQHLKLY